MSANMRKLCDYVELGCVMAMAACVVVGWAAIMALPWIIVACVIALLLWVAA